MVQYVRVEQPPSAEEAFAFAKLLFISAIGFGIYWLWQLINNWANLSAPYKYFAAFYYYTIIIPIRTFSIVWNWIQNHAITSYPNLNFCLSIAGIIIYFIFFIISIGVISTLIKNAGIKVKSQLGIIFLPAFLSFIWFVGSFTFSWLFSQS